MVITSHAPNADGAAKFIDYLLDGKVGRAAFELHQLRVAQCRGDVAGLGGIAERIRASTRPKNSSSA
jgi:spermidine/putrescine-binding protein